MVFLPWTSQMIMVHIRHTWQRQYWLQCDRKSWTTLCTALTLPPFPFLWTSEGWSMEAEIMNWWWAQTRVLYSLRSRDKTFPALCQEEWHFSLIYWFCNLIHHYMHTFEDSKIVVIKLALLIAPLNSGVTKVDEDLKWNWRNGSRAQLKTKIYEIGMPNFHTYFPVHQF